MAVANKLQEARMALRMIHPDPFNAEAPSEALSADITPTELHYVRSNFAVPVYDGRLEVSGAVDNPTTLTLDDLRAMPAVEHVVTLECAGNGRLEMRPLPVGEPWGDYAVSTARWTGALLHEVLERAHPAADGIEVLFTGADHGAYLLQPVLPETNKNDLTFMRSLPLTHAADRAAEILIAYEMNGEPLSPDHGAPFRLIVPRWYAVASVKWLKRIAVLTEPYSGEFQTGHYTYQWPDRPHEAVTLTRVRARITDPARRRHRPPAAGADHRRRDRARPHPAGVARRPAVGVDVLRADRRSDGGDLHAGDRGRPAHATSPRDGCSRQRATRCPSLEPARLWKQRDRGHSCRRALSWRSARYLPDLTAFHSQPPIRFDRSSRILVAMACRAGSVRRPVRLVLGATMG